MFVRTYNKKLKNGSTASHAYLVKNSWNSIKKKTQQRIVAALGKVEELPHTGVIEEIITALDKFAQKEGFAALSKGIVLSSLSSEKFCNKTYDWGSLELVNHILKTLSFPNIIANCFKNGFKPAIGDSKEKQKKGLKQSKKKGLKGKQVSLPKIQAVLVSLLAYQLQGNSTASERKTYLWHQNKVFLPNKLDLKIDNFYRTLDFLMDNKDKIQKQYYQRNKNLFNQGLDLVLFDTTSIYYWGEKGDAAKNTKYNYDEALLRYSGYSKDHRTDLKQLMVGVLMAEDLKGNAVPVAHETYPGTQSDLVSFSQIIDRLKKEYKIKRVIFVADKGMTSEDNLRILEDNNMEYILAVKTKKLNPILKQALIFNSHKQNMKEIKDNLLATEFKMTDFLKTGSIWPSIKNPNPKKKTSGKKAVEELIRNIYKNSGYYKSKTGSEQKDKKDIRSRMLKRRYFICLNPVIAKDKQEKRKFFKKIIKNKIKYEQNKKWIVKNGYKSYLKVGKLDIKLDKEKLDLEKHYDGKWILVTNNQTMTPRLAAIRYKSLRFVEQGFKDLKSLIKIRPIFHQTEDRIKAHVFVSFLTLILKWYVYQMLDTTTQTTGKRFIEKVNNIKAVEIDKRHKVYVRTEVAPKLQKLMKLLKMTIPQKILLDNRPVKKQWVKRAGRPRKKRIHSGQVKLF